jgi:hypothetical protein
VEEEKVESCAAPVFPGFARLARLEIPAGLLFGISRVVS